jgi:hypothetical protein
MSHEPPLLPEGACLLHIGPYKTGSTAVQSAMHGARPRLAEHGVVYAGRGTRDRRAGWAVMEREPRGREAPRIEEWHALVDEVRAARQQRVCVSNEDFARLGQTYVDRIADDLGRDRLHVLAVARRFDRLLPSQWQERVKCHETATYDLFLREVLDPDSEHPVHRAFWASHGVEGMVERWGAAVGPENVTVVVSDDSDRHLLLHTFESMLGLPRGFLALDERSNPSLPINGVEFLRRLNERFDEDSDLTDWAYFHLIQRGAIPRMKYAPRSQVDAPIPPLPAWAAKRVAELSLERVASLTDLGVNIVGDPKVLLTDPAVDAPAGLPLPPESLSLDLAVKAVEGVVEATLKARRQAKRQVASTKPAAKKTHVRKNPVPAGRPVEETRAADLLREAARRATSRARRALLRRPSGDSAGRMRSGDTGRT